eukprot:scaffold11537_cov129-Isochrysis_galbana.AAC.1
MTGNIRGSRREAGDTHGKRSTRLARGEQERVHGARPRRATRYTVGELYTSARTHSMDVACSTPTQPPPPTPVTTCGWQRHCTYDARHATDSQLVLEPAQPGPEGRGVRPGDGRRHAAIHEGDQALAVDAKLVLEPAQTSPEGRGVRDYLLTLTWW